MNYLLDTNIVLIYDLALITTDQDFAHLDREYIALKYVNINEYRK